MKITEIKTYLMHANVSGSRGWRARNWLFVKIMTDEGWPEEIVRVVVGKKFVKSVGGEED